MNKLTKRHFSLADWYFQPEIDWLITDTHYLSSPSSLTIWRVTGAHSGTVFLKDALGKCIANGRLIINHFWQSTMYRTLWLIFRAQEYTTTDFPLNSYYVRLFVNDYFLYRNVAGDRITLASGALPHLRVDDTWEAYRLTWWIYIDEFLVVNLRVVFEQRHAGEWVEVFTHDDPDPQFSDSEFNRVAVRFDSFPNLTMTAHIDDTEVWKKTS